MSLSKPRPEGPGALRERALGLLARREHSRFELRRKLSDAGTTGFDAELETVLDGLATAGLQCDRRYAESFVRSRVERGQGPVRIRQELRRRGVDATLANQALDEAEVDWDTCLREVHRKRFGSAPPVDRREQARRIRFLAQRGFSEGAIRALLTDPGEA